MKTIFKNLGKAPSGLPPSQIHKSNIYFQSLEKTKSKGDYEKSVEALSPIFWRLLVLTFWQRGSYKNPT